MGCGLMVGLATLSLILVVTGLETNHIDPYNEIPDEANNIADTRRAEEVHEEQILEYKDTKGRVQVDHNGGHDRLGHFTPTWAIHVPGGKGEADAVAAEHGFVNLGEIFDNHFHFHHTRVRKRSIDPASAQHERLASDARVRWARQQRILSRAKRDLIYIPQDPRHKRDVQSSRTKGKPRSADNKFILNDPKWPHMWYLNRGGGLDMNVIPAWREGITGRGVVVTILDDGLETDHPDLIANYDALASYDVNSHDSDPQPRYDMIDSNRHGTRCAGEVAATANNSLCAVGVAFGARVGGVRMLDGDVTDAVEARSLSLNPQHVDIYSASWGPDDDGKTVDGPGELATRAFIEGVNKGRNGKGSIFIWASGNGGRDQDNCNCDGYTNSIWTLSISSATERGDVPWYSEMCSSTLATTYSSGALNEKQVVTTDLHHSCTSGHTGTSASAPLAAGICALALQANRDLTWRDMQHIVVRTSRPERLSASGNWHINGVGRNVSHSFGYGLLDAAGMVRLARNWRTVPPQRRCELAAAKPERAVPARGSVVLQMNVQSCPGVNYLEHVQAKVTLSSTRRGDLQIFLTSPAGTRVTLLAPRAHDTSRAGFNSWPFMSVHMWGESPIGVWQLEVHNEGRYMGGALTQWELIFYGTDTPPHEDGSPAVDDNYLGSSESKSRSGYPSKTHMRGEEEKPHNDLEDDMTLDVWSTHKIREDAGTSQSEGRTAQGMTSGCVATSVTSSNHCIECQQTFHLFDGRCYAHCPSHTYTSETLTHTRSQNVTSTSTTEPPNISTSLMKRAFHSREGISEGQSSEIADMLAYEEQPKTPNICLPCHYTCLTCKGPSNHDCLTCPEDAQLVNVTSSDDGSKLFFCYPSSLVPQISNGKWYHQLNLYFAIIVFVIATVVLYKFFTCAINYGFCDFCCCSKDTTDSVAYNKVALDEKQQSAFEITAEIKRAIESSSESETEDDLNL